MIPFGIIIGVVLICIGPLMYYLAPKIGPNPFFGFRIGFTFQSRNVWDKANRYAGKNLLTGGILLTVLGLILPQASLSSFVFSIAFIFVIVELELRRPYLYAQDLVEQEGLLSEIKGKITPIKPIVLPAIYYILPYLAICGYIILSLVYIPSIPQEKVATHFNSIGIPDDWMLRHNFLGFSLGLGVAFLSFLSFIFWAGKNKPVIFNMGIIPVKPEFAMKFVSIIFIIVFTVISIAQYDTIYYNQTQTHLLPFPGFILAMISLISLPVIILAYKVKVGYAKQAKEAKI